MSWQWLKQYPFMVRGLVVALFSLAAIIAVFFNLRAMEDNRVSQYRNLAAHLSALAAEYLPDESRWPELLDFTRMQTHTPDIEFVGIHVDGRLLGSAISEMAYLFPAPLLDTSRAERLLLVRQGGEMYLSRKFSYAGGGGEKQGLVLVVFSMREFLDRQQNILWASGLILLLILAVMVLFYLLDKTQSQLKLRNTDLQSTREQLEREEQTRSEMIKAIAHDALHYVTVIKMINDNQLALLRKGQGLPDIQTHIQNILESNDALTQLLENLKYNEYLGKGLLINRPRAVNWAEFLSAVLLSLAELFKKKKVTARFDPGGPPYKVLVDRELAKSVLLNLLHNAFKFTRPGSTIEVWLEREGDRIKTFIRDQGAGIPREAWESVFRPAVRLDDSAYVRPEDKRGSGLGLSNARQIVELSHGQMGVAESEPGRGTTFYFTLPLALETFGLEKEVTA